VTRRTGTRLALLAALGVAGWAAPAAAEADFRAELDAVIEAAVALSAERGAIEAALAGLPEAQRDAVADFYQGRGFAPYWTADTARGEALVAALSEADRHGLPAARYGADDVARAFEAGDAGEAEIAATRAFLAYARDMKGGVLVPSRVDSEINLTPERPDHAALLAMLAAAPAAEAIAALEPTAPEYRALIEERARLEVAAATNAWGEPVPEGAALRRGDRDPRVAALRERLAALGHPAEAAGDDRAEFDAGLHAALEAFQERNGLIADGILGTRTLAALNASPEDRIAQILVNLERLRWMPDDLGARHVLVNIPAFTTSVVENGERVYHTRSIVGENLTQTPEFSDRMTYLVVNPTWYIPDSIAKRVYLPQLRQDPTVLARNNMRLFTRSGTEIDPGLVDFAELGDSFPFRVRQNPSASNALGRVKFMFPNQFAIYLHDTPNRELFDRDARGFSNGCVRLEDPFELAHYLLAPQLDDPQAQFQAWVDAQSERYVTLDEPIAVHITYRTAWADEGGVHFRADIYGRDARVLEALHEAGVAPAVQATAAVSEGRAG
jgi:L,D-transpeptidase YcbB